MDIMECGNWGFPQLGVHSGGPPIVRILVMQGSLLGFRA